MMIQLFGSRFNLLDVYGTRGESAAYYRDIADIRWTIEDIGGQESYSMNSMSLLAGKQLTGNAGKLPGGISAGCTCFRPQSGIQRDGYRRFHHAMASLILVLVYILVLAINRELSAATLSPSSMTHDPVLSKQKKQKTFSP